MAARRYHEQGQIVGGLGRQSKPSAAPAFCYHITTARRGTSLASFPDARGLEAHPHPLEPHPPY